MSLHEWDNELFIWGLRETFPPCFCYSHILPRSNWHWELSMCLIFDTSHRDWLLSACVLLQLKFGGASRAPGVSHWSLAASAAGKSRPKGKLRHCGRWGCCLQSHPYFPALCGAVPGDNGPLQGWKSETFKEESPHRAGRSHTVCLLWGKGLQQCKFYLSQSRLHRQFNISENLLDPKISWSMQIFSMWLLFGKPSFNSIINYSAGAGNEKTSSKLFSKEPSLVFT